MSKLILSLIAFVLCSCSLSGQKDKNQTTHSAQLSVNDSSGTKVLIRSPGNCTHMILLDKVGNGRLIFGTVNSTKQQYTEEFKDFEHVAKEADFQISSKQSLDSVNSILANLAHVDLIKSPQRHDAYRWELFLSGVKEIDEYGKSQTIMDLLAVLSKYLPFEIDYTCF